MFKKKYVRYCHINQVLRSWENFIFSIKKWYRVQGLIGKNNLGVVNVSKPNAGKIFLAFLRGSSKNAHINKAISFVIGEKTQLYLWSRIWKFNKVIMSYFHWPHVFFFKLQHCIDLTSGALRYVNLKVNHSPQISWKSYRLFKFSNKLDSNLTFSWF